VICSVYCQEGPHDRGEIDEGIPIRVVARQATRLVRENDPDTPERDGGHQFLKAGALTILARLAQIRINAPDPFGGPAQGQGALHERVLMLPSLVMLVDLLQRRLADIDIGSKLMVMGGDCLMDAAAH
jgi:hypothetical protein